jgi:hypothetical protein
LAILLVELKKSKKRYLYGNIVGIGARTGIGADFKP